MDWLNRFFLLGSTPPDQLLPTSHDPWLVGLSVLVAVVTSYVALSLSDRAREAPARSTALTIARTNQIDTCTGTLHRWGSRYLS